MSVARGWRIRDRSPGAGRCLPAWGWVARPKGETEMINLRAVADRLNDVIGTSECTVCVGAVYWQAEFLVVERSGSRLIVPSAFVCDHDYDGERVFPATEDGAVALAEALGPFLKDRVFFNYGQRESLAMFEAVKYASRSAARTLGIKRKVEAWLTADWQLSVRCGKTTASASAPFVHEYGEWATAELLAAVAADKDPLTAAAKSRAHVCELSPTFRGDFYRAVEYPMVRVGGSEPEFFVPAFTPRLGGKLA